MKIKVNRLRDDVKLPTYATEGSACFDIYANMSHYKANLESGDTVVIPTGLRFEIPEGHVMMIYSRSGHGFKNNVRLSNCVGVIDSDYRGEVMVKLTCDFGNAEASLVVKDGDRIAQGMIIPTYKVDFQEAVVLSETVRSSGGFGSTG